jgi:hypothetical protein
MGANVHYIYIIPEPHASKAPQTTTTSHPHKTQTSRRPYQNTNANRFHIKHVADERKQA